MLFYDDNEDQAHPSVSPAQLTLHRDESPNFSQTNWASDSQDIPSVLLSV